MTFAKCPSLDLLILLPVAGRDESPPKPEEDLLMISVRNRDP